MRNISLKTCPTNAITKVIIVAFLLGCGSSGNEGDIETDSGTSSSADFDSDTDCVAGEYLASEGSSTSDRVCAACAAGEYND